MSKSLIQYGYVGDEILSDTKGNTHTARSWFEYLLDVEDMKEEGYIDIFMATLTDITLLTFYEDDKGDAISGEDFIDNLGYNGDEILANRAGYATKSSIWAASFAKRVGNGSSMEKMFSKFIMLEDVTNEIANGNMIFEDNTVAYTY